MASIGVFSGEQADHLASAIREKIDMNACRPGFTKTALDGAPIISILSRFQANDAQFLRSRQRNESEFLFLGFLSLGHRWIIDFAASNAGLLIRSDVCWLLPTIRLVIGLLSRQHGLSKVQTLAGCKIRRCKD